MSPDAHRTKAERIERSLSHCTVSDHETVIEGCMLAGTHWFNLLLHRTGLRAPDHDAMHSEFMTVGERRKVALALPEALAALDAIEALRTTHVRGDLDGGEDAAEAALRALRVLREAATA